MPLKMELGEGGSGSLPRPHCYFVDVRGGGEMEGRLTGGAEPSSRAAQEAGRDMKSQGVFRGQLVAVGVSSEYEERVRTC